MAKQSSTPLEQTSRLLDLVPFLLAHQGISIEDLSAHFKVDKEVMLEDLNTLWMCGLPGYTPLELIDLNFDSGYVTIRNAAPLARIRTMSSSEIISLILGLDILRENSSTLSDDNLKKLDALSTKLRSLVNVLISVSDRSASSHRTLITKAIATRSSVEIDYFSPTSDKESKRTITPFHFFEENGVEYLQAHCHLAQGSRTFRVDRINGSRPVDGAPTIEGSPSDSLEKIRVLALVHSLDRATSEALELSSEALTPGNPVEIEAFSTDWLLRTVLASDSGLEIIEPVSLRPLIAKRVDAAIALYE